MKMAEQTKSPLAIKQEELKSDLERIDDAMLSILGEKKERFLKTSWLAVRDNPELLKCNRMSLLGAIVKSAELGLELNTPLGLAYIIPFKGNATLQIGYKGMLNLAYRSSKIAVFEAEIVYEKDEFYYEKGLNPVLKHIPSEEVDRGEIKCVYAICRLTNGFSTFIVMSKREIEEIRIKAQTQKVWLPYYEQMAKKTALKRLVKYIPAEADLSMGVELDSKYEAGIVQKLDAERVPEGAEDLTDLEQEEEIKPEAGDGEREKKLVDAVNRGMKKDKISEEKE
jgi:recombination protein RecT